MYRDHRKGPGGPPGGATHPGGPHGLTWEGSQPIVGWCAPLGPPPAPRVETLGVGGRPTWLGGHSTPLAAAPPPWEIDLPGPAPPLGAYIKEGEGGQLHPEVLAPPSPLLHLSLSQKLGEALLEPCCIHHHAVVLLDLHQPLLPPCWIKKEDTSLLRTCVERGGAVRSTLGSPVIWITTSTTPSTPFS